MQKTNCLLQTVVSVLLHCGTKFISFVFAKSQMGKKADLMAGILNVLLIGLD